MTFFARCAQMWVHMRAIRVRLTDWLKSWPSGHWLSIISPAARTAPSHIMPVALAVETHWPYLPDEHHNPFFSLLIPANRLVLFMVKPNIKETAITRRAVLTGQVGMPGAEINLIRVIIGLFVMIAIMPSGVYAKDAGGGASTGPVRVVAFGDSLTAGYGLRPGQAFPDVLQMALRARGHDVEVINAGVSGDTTAAGLQRLDWAVGQDADAVIVELGANDALRGQPPAETRANLDKIVSQLGARGLPVLIAGMRSPENWGSDYRDRFDAIFADLAAKHSALYYPFFLDGVATDPKLNLNDGLHPNPRGVAIIVERILPKVEELIGRVRAGAGSTVPAEK